MENNNWHLEETYKSLIQISLVVMRFILIANGGAAVALMAYTPMKLGFHHFSNLQWVVFLAVLLQGDLLVSLAIAPS